MSAFFKVHEVEVWLPEGQADTAPDSVVRKVNVQPISSTKAYEQYGVDVKNALELFDDADAAPYYKVHGRVSYNEVTYAVAASAMTHDTFATASHCRVLLTEVRRAS